MKVEVTLVSDMLRVEFGGTLHLSVYYPYLYGVQSWVENDSQYCIRYYTKQGNIDCLYHDIDLWKKVIGGVSAFV